MTSATEKLRRMLDERGVERYEHEAPATDCIAFFGGRGWHDCWESVDGEVNVTFSMTPEQAIAATLGSCNCSNSERTGTCHPVISDNLMESEGTGDAWADCSECGHLLFVLTDPNSEPPKYCPNCGAKVVEPTTNDVDAEVDS